MSDTPMLTEQVILKLQADLAAANARVEELRKVLEYCEAGWMGRLDPMNNSPQAVVANALGTLRAIDAAIAAKEKPNEP